MDPGRRALIAALLLAGCGAPGGGGPPDADPFRPDAAIPSCSEGSAVIGRCQVAGVGTECTGVPDEDRQFVPLLPGDQVDAVVGPQGARMFVLALRTGGIQPGDPLDPTSDLNPDVTITLVHAADLMALYRGTPGFLPTDTADQYEVAGLFVVTDLDGSQLAGLDVVAVAEIEDADGQQRCGTVDFVAAAP